MKLGDGISSRGGNIFKGATYGYDYTVSERAVEHYQNANFDLGFRPALYLK